MWGLLWHHYPDIHGHTINVAWVYESPDETSPTYMAVGAGVCSNGPTTADRCEFIYYIALNDEVACPEHGSL